MQTLEKERLAIARRVRDLRRERRWTQAELARRLELSQSRLSEVENGQGSFTAEQFLVLLRIFNVGVGAFVAEQHGDVEGELQNALARLGATHLQEVPDVLPSEQLERATDAIRETIALGSSRQLTALGPVIVQTIDRLDIHRVRAELARLGFHRRLSWVLENVAEALRSELETSSPPRAWAQRYRRALLVIETALGLAQDAFDSEREPVDVLDPNVRSKQSLKETVASSSALSRKWGVATVLTPKDFAKALRAARGG